MFDIVKDIFAIIGILAIIYKIAKEVLWYYYLKNNW